MPVVSLVSFAEGGQGKIVMGSYEHTKVAMKSFKHYEDKSDEMLNLREVVMLEKIRHPNIINIMAVVFL